MKGTLLEWLAGALVVFVAVNRGAVDVILTGTVTSTRTATTDLIWDCVIMNLPILLMHLPILSIHPLYPDDLSLPFCRLLPSAPTKLLKY